MIQHIKKTCKSIVAIIMVTMLFLSCKNDTQKVKDFLIDKNLPIGVAKNVFHVYKDSGKISSKLQTSLLHDYTNRKEHPYNEFPKGIKIITIDKSEKDSTTITGNYALTYNKTNVAEIVGNVVIVNHTQKSKLITDQLYWDRKLKYFFSEEKFIFTTATNDTIVGIGFECKQNLSKWIAKDAEGSIKIKQNKNE